MVVALVPFVCALVGAFVYLAANGKLAELGRLLFLAGVLTLAWLLSGQRVHL